MFLHGESVLLLTSPCPSVTAPSPVSCPTAELWQLRGVAAHKLDPPPCTHRQPPACGCCTPVPCSLATGHPLPPRLPHVSGSVSIPPHPILSCPIPSVPRGHGTSPPQGGTVMCSPCLGPCLLSAACPEPLTPPRSRRAPGRAPPSCTRSASGFHHVLLQNRCRPNSTCGPGRGRAGAGTAPTRPRSGGRGGRSGLGAGASPGRGPGAGAALSGPRRRG